LPIFDLLICPINIIPFENMEHINSKLTIIRQENAERSFEFGIEFFGVFISARTFSLFNLRSKTDKESNKRPQDFSPFFLRNKIFLSLKENKKRNFW
jgi:hypothetical protein